MDNSVEKKILNHLKGSKESWTDIFDLINLKNGTYREHGDLLKAMLEDRFIKLKDPTAVNRLNLTRKEKLIKIPELSAKITKEGKDHLSSLSFFQEKK